MTVKKNMSFEDYLKFDALSNSGMEDLRKSPAHYQYSKANRTIETDAMTFGSMVHCAILEPQELDKRYIAKPKGHDGRTTKGKKFNADCEASGLSVVEAVDLVDAKRIAKEIFEFEENNLGVIVQGSEKEFSIFWEKDGVAKKGRPDSYFELCGGICIDVKTTRSPLLDGFEREVWNRGYHRKAAHYREGLLANNLPCKHVIFIAIDNSPGYRDFLVYLMRPDIVELGARQNDQTIKLFKDCLKSNYWPGYPKTILELGVPTWAINKLSEDELT